MTPVCSAHGEISFNPSPPFPFPSLPSPRFLPPSCLRSPLCEDHSRAASVFCLWSELRGGLRLLQLLGFTRGGERGCVRYPAVSLCLCCFTPAAARHQIRLLQLTLHHKNNELLCDFPSSNTLQQGSATGQGPQTDGEMERGPPYLYKIVFYIKLVPCTLLLCIQYKVIQEKTALFKHF